MSFTRRRGYQIHINTKSLHSITPLPLTTHLFSHHSDLATPMPTHFLAYLDECVSTTEQCSSSLASGLNKLYPGVEDIPRLSKIFRNHHVSVRSYTKWWCIFGVGRINWLCADVNGRNWQWNLADKDLTEVAMWSGMKMAM